MGYETRRLDWLQFMKWLGRAVLALGIIIGLLILLGVFWHQDRIDFLSFIHARNQNPPMTHAAAASFENTFPKPKGDENKEPLTVLDDGGMSVGGKPLMGAVKYGYKDMTTSRPIATFQEIRAWAYESALSLWVPWALSLFGAVAILFTGYLEHKKKGKSRRERKQEDPI